MFEYTLTCHERCSVTPVFLPLVLLLIACITSASIPNHSSVMGRGVRALRCCSDGSINLGFEG